MAKICMIAYTFYQSDPRVRREAEALTARGDTVDFICLQDSKQKSPEELMGVHLYPLFVGRYQGSSTIRYLFKYAGFFIKASFLVTKLFLKKRYDIIHVHTMPDFLVFTALIPKLLGAKVILDVHDLMPELYICKFNKSDSLTVRMITWIERRSISFSDKALAVHIPHRNALVGHGNPESKFSVLMNVPDPRIFERQLDRVARTDHKFRLIYHGTVARRHGLEIALRAVDLLKSKIPELEFLIIGHGDDFDRIKELVKTMRLEKLVRFQDRVSVEELPNYLRLADVGIIPILYDEFTRYMLPLKLMEYVRLGIPAIVTRTETIESYFSDDMVLYVKSGDAPELAEAIWQLYAQPLKRKEMTTHAARFNTEYNWDAQKQNYFALVDSMLNSKHS